MDSVILVRHAQSTANVQRIVTSDYEGYPLTSRGRVQADKLATQLAGARIDGIISSPVQRARETSRIIGDKLGLDYSIDERIQESGLGKFNNFRFTSMPDRLHSDLGMEPWESHIQRFISLMDSLDGRFILVSHAYPIRAVISTYLNLGEHESAGVEVKNATASVIDLIKGSVLCIGSVVLTEKVLDFIS